MQQSRRGQPRHQRGIFNGVPEPPAAPAELVISPIAARRDAHSQENPRQQYPWSHRTCKSGTDFAGEQRTYSKRERNRQPNIADVKRGRVEREADILQQRVQARTCFRGGIQPFKRV